MYEIIVEIRSHKSFLCLHLNKGIWGWVKFTLLSAKELGSNFTGYVWVKRKILTSFKKKVFASLFFLNTWKMLAPFSTIYTFPKAISVHIQSQNIFYGSDNSWYVDLDE